MRAPLLAGLAALLALSATTPAALADSPEGTSWSLGTSAWMLANVLPDSPHFFYVEGDITLGDRDELTLGALTWKYPAPIGIPYGDSFGDEAERYPGHVRSVGLGAGLRHYLFKGLNVNLWSFHLLQLYSEQDRPVRTGYQLFLQGRVGWRLHVERPGFWIEPAIAFNWWPIETGRPASFRERDDRWPSYFLFEPWLNLGFSW